MNEFLRLLREWNDACREARDAFPALLTAESRSATAEEDAEFRRIAAEVAENDERIAEIELQLAAEARAGQVAQALGLPGVQVNSEPLTYQKQRSTYFSDLWKMSQGDVEAKSRLERHGAEMDVELPRREAQRSRNAEREVRNQIGYDQPSPFEKRVNPNRTDGQGGYLVPPLWMMDELIPILRAGRVIADQVRKFDLPDGTDSINIPKLATGTTAAIQTADAASVSSTDFTDTSISAGVKTIAGQQDVAIQLVEQSPLSLDGILFQDLVADYNKKLNDQVMSGSNASGQVKGLYSSAGASLYTSYNQVSYTDGSPTVGEFLAPLAQSISKIAQNRYSTDAIKIFLHPRRWFWMAGTADSTGRAVIAPNSLPSYNQLSANAELHAQGFVGNVVLGPPVFIDNSITTTDTAGSGSNQDVSITLNCDDAFLFEGQLRQRTLPEVLSGTLQVRFQVYNYVAFLLRYDQALAIGSGTGFAAPSGY